MIFKRLLLIITLMLGTIGFSQDAANPLAFPDSCLFVPSAITPDCDQVGCELFSIYFQCEMTDFKIVIYDKYGELVFESTNIEDEWSSDDAEYDGAYTWKITGTMSDSGTPFAVEKKGHVCVLK